MIVGLILTSLILVSVFGAVSIERNTRQENSERNDGQFMWDWLLSILGVGACIVDLIFAVFLDVMDEMGVVGWIGFLILAAIGRYNVWKSEGR